MILPCVELPQNHRGSREPGSRTSTRARKVRLSDKEVAFAIKSAQDALSKSCTGHGHGQSSRASAVLGLDNLVTTELDAVYKVVELLARDVAVARLGDERDDGDAGVTSNDGDVLVSGVGTLDLGNEAGGARGLGFVLPSSVHNKS